MHISATHENLDHIRIRPTFHHTRPFQMPKVFEFQRHKIIILHQQGHLEGKSAEKVVAQDVKFQLLSTNLKNQDKSSNRNKEKTKKAFEMWWEVSEFVLWESGGSGARTWLSVWQHHHPSWRSLWRGSVWERFILQHDNHPKQSAKAEKIFCEEKNGW